MKIALLVPTRNRPHNIERFIKSVLDTANNVDDISISLYIDDDDDSYDKLKFTRPKVTITRGPRIVLSEMWNRAYDAVKDDADIFFHGGDDIIFRSDNWDALIKNMFSSYEDKILFVHGDDMSDVHRNNFGTHGFIHKNWVDAVGYFVPPYFSSDFNDTWLNDVANALNRRVYIDAVKTEHMHYVFNKAEKDQTHEERLARHANDRVDEIYAAKKPEREADVEKLRKVMK